MKCIGSSPLLCASARNPRLHPGFLDIVLPHVAALTGQPSRYSIDGSDESKLNFTSLLDATKQLKTPVIGFRSCRISLLPVTVGQADATSIRPALYARV